MNFYPFFLTSLPPLFSRSLSLAWQGLRGAQIHSGCRGSRADANRIVLTFNIFIFILNIFTDRNSMDAPLATPSYSTPCAQSPVPLDPHLICQIHPAWLQTKTVHHPPARPAWVPMPVLLLFPCSLLFSSSLPPLSYCSLRLCWQRHANKPKRSLRFGLTSNDTCHRHKHRVREGGGKRQERSEAGRQHVCVCVCVGVWNMLSYWFCCIPWARPTQIQLATLPHFANLYHHYTCR